MKKRYVMPTVEKHGSIEDLTKATYRVGAGDHIYVITDQNSGEVVQTLS